MSEAILKYDVTPIKVWKVETFAAHEEVGGDVSSWCTYQNEEKFNYLKNFVNLYMIEDSSQSSPLHKIAVMVDTRILAIDENAEQIDITSYNIPSNIFETKIITHEERLACYPIYRGFNS